MKRKPAKGDKVSITIGTPHLRNFTPEYVLSLTETLMEGRYNYTYLMREGNTLHQQRNLIAQQTTGDYLLFIDTDMVWAPEDIRKMVKLDKDIVTGLCVSKTFPSYPLIMTEWGRLTLEGMPQDPFKVTSCGTGFLLIKKRVLQRLFDLKAWPFDPLPFDIMLDDTPWDHKPTRYLNEDESFILKALTLGFEVWCHPQVRPGHVGVNIFGDGLSLA